jgi:LacI family transcriptional regulator
MLLQSRLSLYSQVDMPPATPTMSDIARRAGVSKNAVSLALRGSPEIPLKTRRRIERIAQSLGYKKNSIVAHLMAELRKGRSPAHQSTLALLNANADPTAFTGHPTIPAYVTGCRRRAGQLGYSLDDFWLHDPALTGQRLNKILRARNIRGVVVVGLMKENRLPARFLPTWREFHTVVTGVRTHEPTLSFACTDHHALAWKAMENALRLGYQRPALVLDHEIDRLVEGRFSAGFRIAQQRLPQHRQIEPFYLVNEARSNPQLFRDWFAKAQPDVLLTLYNVVQDWLRGMSLRVPHDIGLIQLERRKENSDWAGMDQHNDVVGEAAVEMVINMIHHHPPRLPLFPVATLIGSTWVSGQTIRKKNKAAPVAKR